MDQVLCRFRIFLTQQCNILRQSGTAEIQDVFMNADTFVHDFWVVLDGGHSCINTKHAKFAQC